MAGILIEIDPSSFRLYNSKTNTNLGAMWKMTMIWVRLYKDIHSAWLSHRRSNNCSLSLAIRTLLNKTDWWKNIHQKWHKFLLVTLVTKKQTPLFTEGRWRWKWKTYQRQGRLCNYNYYWWAFWNWLVRFYILWHLLMSALIWIPVLLSWFVR